jgi:hypothetical protein
LEILDATAAAETRYHAVINPYDRVDYEPNLHDKGREMAKQGYCDEHHGQLIFAI